MMLFSYEEKPADQFPKAGSPIQFTIYYKEIPIQIEIKESQRWDAGEDTQGKIKIRYKSTCPTPLDLPGHPAGIEKAITYDFDNRCYVGSVITIFENATEKRLRENYKEWSAGRQGSLEF